MNTRDYLLALAERVEALAGPDGWVDTLVWHAVGSGEAYTPAYTASLDAAMTLPIKGFIAAMGEIVADGLPGVCLCVSTDPVREVWGVSYGAGDVTDRLARAYTAAALRALAECGQ